MVALELHGVKSEMTRQDLNKHVLETEISVNVCGDVGDVTTRLQ
jgi:hypothetical protein